MSLSPIKRNIANALTLLNFTLGLCAILLAATVPSYEIVPLGTQALRRYTYACALVILAGLMDRFDGKVARKMQTVSDLGKQLDSLSDLVSFGVAPTVLVFHVYAQMAPMAEGYGRLPILLMGLVLFFPIAGALRLAKFNIQEDPSYFVGIPITMAGSMTALLTLLFLQSNKALAPRGLAACLLLLFFALLAVLMISPFKMKKR